MKGNRKFYIALNGEVHEVSREVYQAYYQNILDNSSEIRESAFDACRTIENAAIPEVITAIGGSAFQYNYQLKKAELPIGLLTIGAYAFHYME